MRSRRRDHGNPFKNPTEPGGCLHQPGPGQIESREPGRGPAQQAPKTDTVVISETAKRVQDAKAQLDSIPDVRADKVAELKSRVENGSYEIQPDKIADKMIRESLLNDLFK